MSRYIWKGRDYEEIDVGDKFIIVHTSRWSPSTFTGPFPVSRVTEQSFWLQMEDGSERRFLRSYGHEFGKDSYKAERATKERIDELNEAEAKRKAEQEEKENAEYNAEMNRRVDWDVEDIKDEKAQEMLKEIRLIAGKAEQGLREIQKAAEGFSVEEPWNLVRAMEWRGYEKLVHGAHVADMCRSIHHRLAETFRAFHQGIEFEYRDSGRTVNMSKAAGTMVTYVMKRDLECQIQDVRRLIRYDNNDKHETEWRIYLVDALEDAMGWKWGRAHFSRVKSQEVA